MSKAPILQLLYFSPRLLEVCHGTLQDKQRAWKDKLEALVQESCHQTSSILLNALLLHMPHIKRHDSQAIW